MAQNQPMSRHDTSNQLVSPFLDGTLTHVVNLSAATGKPQSRQHLIIPFRNKKIRLLFLQNSNQKWQTHFTLQRIDGLAGY